MLQRACRWHPQLPQPKNIEKKKNHRHVVVESIKSLYVYVDSWYTQGKKPSHHTHKKKHNI